MSMTVSADGGGSTNPTWKSTDAVVIGCGIVTSIGSPARISAARAGGSVQLVSPYSRRIAPRTA